MSWLSGSNPLHSTFPTPPSVTGSSSRPACPGLAQSRYAPAQEETGTDIPPSTPGESSSLLVGSDRVANLGGATDDRWNQPQYDTAATTASEDASAATVTATPVRHEQDTTMPIDNQDFHRSPKRSSSLTFEPDMNLERTTAWNRSESSAAIHGGARRPNVKLGHDERSSITILDDENSPTVDITTAASPESIGTTRSRADSMDSGFASDVYSSPTSDSSAPNTDMLSEIVPVDEDEEMVFPRDEAISTDGELTASDEFTTTAGAEMDLTLWNSYSMRRSGYPARGRSSSMGGEYFSIDDRMAAHAIIEELLEDDSAPANITDATPLSDTASEGRESGDYMPLEQYVDNIRTEIRSGPSINTEVQESEPATTAIDSTDTVAMLLRTPLPNFSFTDMTQWPIIRSVRRTADESPQATTSNLEERNAEVDAGCPICLTRYGELNGDGIVESYVTTPCNHRFGIHCLARWTGVENHSQCPLCRGTLPYDSMPRPTTLGALPTTFRWRPRAASASPPRLPDLGENRLGPPFGHAIPLPIAPEITTTNAEGTSTRPRRGTIATILTEQLAEITRHERSLEIAEVSVRVLLRQRETIDHELDHLERQIREACARLRELRTAQNSPGSADPTSTRAQIMFGSLQFDTGSQIAPRWSTDIRGQNAHPLSPMQIHRDVFVEHANESRENEPPRAPMNTPAIFSPTSFSRVRDFAEPNEAFHRQVRSVQAAIARWGDEVYRDPSGSHERLNALLEEHRQLSAGIRSDLGDTRSRSVMTETNGVRERLLDGERTHPRVDLGSSSGGGVAMHSTDGGNEEGVRVLALETRRREQLT